ncbi:MAG: peptidase M49 [Vicinamibacterales bacterium]
MSISCARSTPADKKVCATTDVVSGGASGVVPAFRPATEDRKYLLERVGEAAVVQLYADGFSALPVDQRILIWHLYQAAIAGRDIFYDQRYAHNLEMRDVLEAIIRHPSGESDTRAEIERYTKLFWINTGPYNNLTARKFVLKCTPEQFAAAAHEAAGKGAMLPLRNGESLEALLDRLTPMFFDVTVDPAVTTKTPDEGRDILQASANNLYSGVAMKDLERVDEQYPLNSRLAKKNGKIVEEVYRVGGLYDPQIREVVRHLESAIPYATEPMANALRALIQWYRTGDDGDRRAYDIAWVADKSSPVDTINGFTEVYLDARGIKGAWEALVYYVNTTKTAAIQKLAAEAQWFESRMPWDPQYCKESVQGITANVIDVVIETGDAGPLTAIGINLPNEQDVREQYGSKSVSIANVNEAYDRSLDPGFRSEFAWSPDEVARAEKWQGFAHELATDLHEVIGHASGKMHANLGCSPQKVLKEQYSAIEESRADLVALYFLPDPKLVQMGLIRAEDHEDVVRTEYENYARAPLAQLRRIREGTTIEEDHMRNRQMIVHWLMAHTKAIEKRTREGKTYYVMVDSAAFRDGVARLLAEVQRIKANGDYPAAKALFDAYGIHFDAALRDEIVARVDKLKLPSYTGFVQPKLEPVHDADGTIRDVAITYPLDLTGQMLAYSEMTRSTREQFRASSR